jgi:chondroitin AC lyase
MNRILSLLLVLAASISAFGADIDVVRSQFTGYYGAAGADRNGVRLSTSLEQLEAVTRQITGPDWFRSDGSWIDLTYSGTPDGGWGPWEHTRRLLVLAKAYRTPGQGLYLNATLRSQIEAAIAYTKTYYGASILPTGNWWFWTIGIPIDLGPTLVLMQGAIDPQVFDDAAQSIQLRIGATPTGRGLVGPVPTGENLVWTSFTHLCLGLVRNDPARLALVRDAMATVARPSSLEGIKRDRSFHQHGAQLYTGGYGGAFANDVARYALVTGNTAYALPPDALSSFADYVADGIAWSMYGNYFDVSVIGREVARSSTTGFHGLAAMLQASQLNTPRANELRSAAAKMLETWNGTLPSELASLATRVDALRAPAAWPSGHRHYYTSDYTIHRRSGWFASVKMFSTRTKSGENTNDENIHGARQSDGRFYLTQRGDELFGRDVLPALDWARLPGTTVEQKADTADDTYNYGMRSFAGGTGDGQNGVTAMELSPLNSQLFARKAWFFFDDAIVFVTNSILSPSGNRVETIVNQVNTSAAPTRGADWLALDNVGYWFPTSSTDLKIATESRTGTWAALGGSSDTTAHTKPFVTMYLDHGTQPTNASAEYVIVPNKNATAMAQWVSTRPLAIGANNDTISAVRDLRTGALGITFWRAGSFEGIQSNAQAVVYLTTSGNTMQLSAADPNGTTTGSFTLTIPGSWTATGAVATRTTRATTITIPRNAGQTTTVLLTKAGTNRRRSVRR